ncbi:MAG: DUF4837 family protein [Mediterranea sp.]|jgi:hypothetical protein|nr:DUF4837 family protein [Mediterranea sp.]
MRTYLSCIGLALATLCLTACGGGKKGFGATSSGRAYEVLVVVDLGLWERPAGRALNDVLKSDVPGLPQAESSFYVMYTSPSNFDGALKIVRNIVMVDIQNIYTQPKLKYAKDMYATPQMILTIQAPDEASFQQFVTDNKQTIIDFFTRAEMNRQIAVLQQNHNKNVFAQVKNMFGCDVWVPSDLTSSKVGKDFFWASNNAGTGEQNFVIYSFPYRDKNTFTKEFFVHVRDSVMKANIPGARQGMYMETNALLSDVRPFSLKGEYVLEMRGLWRVKGDQMGGPYVTQMRLDRVNQRIIVAEVFVYSPDRMKRNLMRQIEASLYTLRLPDDNGQNTQIPIEGTTTNNEKENGRD